MTDRPSSADIEEAAARWVIRLDAGRPSDDEQAAFARWLASDTRCRGALLQAEAAWLPLFRLRQEDHASPIADEPTEDRSGWRSVSGRRAVLLGMAGTAAASVAGLFMIARRPVRYETTIGEVRRVPLADRSTMAVNTSSRISVAYTPTSRAVSVDRGEAWFQVRKDPSRPFLVSAGPIRVEAVGTAFSVRRRDGGAEVMVTEGVVRVWNEEDEPGAVRLAAGTALFMSDTHQVRPSVVRAPAIERRLAWRSGQLNLEGETLGEAVDEFNRFNATRIVVQDQEVAGKRLYGVFRLDDPQGFARTAAISLGVAAWQDDERIMIATTRR